MPIIGCTMRFPGEGLSLSLAKAYADSLLQTGALPWLLPHTVDPAVLQQMLSRCDGLLLGGGGDLDPIWFGEEPWHPMSDINPALDCMEIALVRLFAQANKPIFAICRGCQVLNVALGGDIYQDLGTQYPSCLQHTQQAATSRPWHAISISPDSLIAQCYEPPTQRVNSFHHQALRRVAPSLRATAFAPDGVIEAIEGDGYRFVVGVQWHPECMQECASARALFALFVESCRT